MSDIGLGERVSVWLEVEILSRLTPRQHVGPFFKWVFRIPVLYYKLGLGWMLGKRFLLLMTIGRKTGKLHYTALEFEFNPQEDWYRVSPGWGGNTDWYKNILHNPHVTVQVGRQEFIALAEPVVSEEVAESLRTISRRHPGMSKVWNRWSDVPVDGSFESYLHAAYFFPSVRLRPVK
ncbi:MAG TPA: nitroreductase family deazaflavin-dependent oxidoreductase [Anaerolineales bacterium]|nr:nitroreductase family deazaflavin-dependent oxidoreductase [Anaerolineales bacterium]